MKKLIKISPVLVLILVHIHCNSANAKDCKIKEIKTLFTIIGIHDRDTAYGHYTLIRDFPRECMDSSEMVNAALKYIDTIKIAKPVMGVKFFNSDRHFIPNETSQDMDEINKSCLVDIGFDEKTQKPNDFVFYNSRGERTYWGNRWLPGGEVRQDFLKGQRTSGTQTNKNTNDTLKEHL